MSALQQARDGLKAAQIAHNSGASAEDVLVDVLNVLERVIAALSDTDRHVPRLIGGVQGFNDTGSSVGGTPLPLPPNTPQLSKNTAAQPYDVPLPLDFKSLG